MSVSAHVCFATASADGEADAAVTSTTQRTMRAKHTRHALGQAGVNFAARDA